MVPEEEVWCHPQKKIGNILELSDGIEEMATMRNRMGNSKCTKRVSVRCRDQYQVASIDMTSVDIVWVEVCSRLEAHIR